MDIDEDRYDDAIAEQLRQEHEYDGDLDPDQPIPDTFESTVERFPDRPAQKYKGGIYDRSLAAVGAIDPAPDGGYATLTYEEMADVVRKLAVGFRSLGVGSGDRVGIFAGTRMEWAQSDFALLATGGIVTTVYKSSSPQQVQYLLDDPGAMGVVVRDQELLERVLEVYDAVDLRFAVVMDEIDDRYRERDGIYTLGTVYEEGAKRYEESVYESMVEDVDAEDLATLVYTSGTTGRPKGVRLTHRNLQSLNVQGMKRVGPRPGRPDDAATVDETTQTVSYLPLAHIFERTVGSYLLFSAGACVAYAESVDTLTEDFQAIQPTMATSVPRVYEKIYDAIRKDARETTVAGLDVGERIFEWAAEVGRRYERESAPPLGLRARMFLADKLVFSDVRDALGGNIEMLVSGGGTLSKELCTLYHGMGLPIYEGYGLTETAAGTTFNTPENYKSGTIGIPIADVDLRIDRSVVPEGQFDDALGEFGELLVKGPNVTDGYWNMPEKTDEAFTDDGYFRTGDIVQWRPDGYLVFRERSKQILVLSTGKNVAPSPIEDGFSESEVVEQCMVIGDGEKFVGALVVPGFDHLRTVLRDEGVEPPADDAALIEHDRVRELVAAEVERINEGFEPHERIKQFGLVPEEWTEENEMLTPSKKKKRRDILDEYHELVADIYREEAGDDATSPDPEPAE
ncbi:long-chain fatty acid--CoA ligase [Halobacteriales archaeon QS_8_69_26]|nr:MAG: long-chain fatty acid--CoA ligase [Halobacteriales archaeon QS_8_69_26]